MKPRNNFVTVSVIERPTRQVGAILVPGGGELFAEALVVGVPENGSHTQDLKVGQIVFAEYKRPQRTATGESLKVVGIPFQDGDKQYLILEEAQIIGIIADSIEEYGGKVKATNIAATASALLH